jgi:putative N6-adenine-specific DNA methylase
MHLIGFDNDSWQAIRRDAKDAPTNNEIAPIIATDNDDRAVNAARKNAETAGVHRLIQFHVCDFAGTDMPDTEGIVIMNPQYGQRMGEVAELEATYKRIGDFLKQNCTGWTGYIFTGNRELAKKVGLRAARRMEFHNANIDCRLLKYELYQGTREAYAENPS